MLYESPPETAKFELRTYQAISDLILKHGIQCEYQQMAGGVHAFFWKEAFDKAKLRAQELQKTLPELYRLVRVIEKPEHLAALKIPHAVGAIVQSNAASLSGYKLVTSMFANFLGNDAINLQTTTPVMALVAASDGRWNVETHRGSIRASQVLLTTNAYTGHLLPQFRDLIVPIQAQMSAFVPSSPIEPTLYSYYFIGAVRTASKQVSEDYLIQRPVKQGGEWMYGGGRILAKNGGVNQPDDSYNDDKTVKYLKTSLDYLLDLGDKKDGEDSQLDYKAFWTGIYGQSTDGRPWVGAIPNMPGVFLCGGYSGHGMPNAALCAEHVAKLMTLVRDGEDVEEARRNAARNGEIPLSYTITAERMKAARKLEGVDGFDMIKDSHVLDVY